MIDGLWGKWFLLVFAWVILAAWHLQEYRRLQQRHIEERVYDYPQSPFALLFQKAIDRSLQLVLIAALWVGTIIYYDVRLTTSGPETPQPTITSASSYNQLSPASGGTAQPRTLPPKMLELAPVPIQRAEPVTKASPPAVPVAKPLDTQSELDTLKQRYEEIFITYFYLTRCGLAQKEDYHLINSALIGELSRLDTPASLQQNILTAARGSYDEMYKDSPCSSAYLDPVLPRYNRFLAQVRSQMIDAGL